jgi:hypothetical protein
MYQTAIIRRAKRSEATPTLPRDHDRMEARLAITPVRAFALYFTLVSFARRSNKITQRLT